MWFREPCPPPGARSTALAFDSTQRGPRAGQLCLRIDRCRTRGCVQLKIFDGDKAAACTPDNKRKLGDLNERVTIVGNHGRERRRRREVVGLHARRVAQCCIPCTSATAALIPSQPPAAICHSGSRQSRSKSSKTNQLHSCRLGNLIRRVYGKLLLRHLPSGILLAASCMSGVKASRTMAMTMYHVADRDLCDIQQSSHFPAMHRNTR